MISIIGPSGTGKSTFLRALNMLEPPTGGEILFEGKNILDKRYRLDLMRRKMGMVFQNFNLFEHMTVLDNVTYAPVRLRTRPKPARKAWSCCAPSAWSRRPTSTLPSCPAAKSSVWPSPAPSR